MSNRNTVVAPNFPVEILNEKKEYIKDVDSIHAASKFCLIKNDCSIWNYLFIKQKTERGSRFKGVLAITGKRFHFKLKKEQ